ncbi:hypothetical protein AB1Y20_023006 [Prymnesium parvum]|uniref:Origin recognition complex subunit 3 N-terminal domain-containing protein n=1 Tax=Prymnesium parvum TaxID=97485 RepID=A0AB34JEZ1_PRYPA
MASAPCFLTLPIDGEVAPHRDGFTLFHGESQDFADARHAAYQACAAELQHVVDDVFDRLNQNEFERIAECLKCSRRELQQQWTADQNVQLTPPYTQVLNDFIYAMTSTRTISGQEPLPLALVFVLPSGAEALQSLLSRSTLVLLQAHKFALATTERAVDQVFSRLLQVQQLHYCLIDHFRSNALSYFVPLRTSIPSNASCGDKRSILGVRASSQASKQLAESLDAICSNLSLCQIDALYSLPSVASALDAIPDARGLQARADVLKAELPRWLQRMGFARVRRACAMRFARADGNKPLYPAYTAAALRDSH